MNNHLLNLVKYWRSFPRTTEGFWYFLLTSLHCGEDYSPKAWHCKIFVRPSATVDPDAEGGVMKRGA